MKWNSCWRLQRPLLKDGAFVCFFWQAEKLWLFTAQAYCERCKPDSWVDSPGLFPLKWDCAISLHGPRAWFYRGGQRAPREHGSPGGEAMAWVEESELPGQLSLAPAPTGTCWALVALVAPARGWPSTQCTMRCSHHSEHQLLSRWFAWNVSSVTIALFCK